MVYEVVCTKSYLDIGLLIEKNDELKPKRVLARALAYSSDPEPEYGGVETLTWVHTGVFLSKDEWKNISCDKATDQILSELGIEKNQILSELGIEKKIEKEEDGYMSTDEMAIALIKLYAEHMHTNNGNHNEDYAEAVAIAIRMLTD